MNLIALLLSSLIFIPLIMAIIKRLYAKFAPNNFTRNKIRNLANYFLYPKYFTLVEDVCVKDASGDSYLIPQVLISRYGVFIIELCHYKNDIHGSAHTTAWFSQKGNRRFCFQNPHTQIKHLKRSFCHTMDIPEFVCHTLVIFTGNARLQSQHITRTGKIEDLIPILDNFNKYYIGSGSHNRLVQESIASKQHITKDVKRCIITASDTTPRVIEVNI